MSIVPLVPMMLAGLMAIGLIVGYLVLYGLHPFQNIDRSSAANINELLTVHLDIDLKVDFDQKKLVGSVVHTFKCVSKTAEAIHLDITDLEIHSVEEAKTSQKLQYRLDKWPWIVDDDVSVLTIYLNRKLKFGEEIQMRIEYNTLPSGGALNWLNGKQTASGHEFFYSDSQTYYCRSMIPIQDTPAVKAPYHAKIRVKKPLLALASGVLVGTKEVDGMVEYEFEQKNPVPSYLIAFLAGVLERRSIDHRTFVIAEPQMIDRSVQVLSDIGHFLNIIERDLVPYQWEHYSIVVMPFGYPYGGMENPHITFMSPSIITAGKEAEHVAAHEIAHSWFGNLITCKNWTHTWINEGFTVYSERHIVQQFFGAEVFEENSVIGEHNLEETMKNLEDTPEATKLTVLTNRLCPEFGFTTVAYEKGYLFMKKLEGLMGKANLFKFLRKYLLKHQFGSVATEDFILDFEQFALSALKNGTEVLRHLNWEKEFRSPGMPENYTKFSNPKIEAARGLAREYHQKHGEPPVHPELYQSFNSHLKIIFMIELTKLRTSREVIERVDKDQDVTGRERNPETLLYWLKLNIPVRLAAVRETIDEYVGMYGRGKYLIPVYRGVSLVKMDFARALFQKYGSNYNPRIADIIKGILHIQFHN